MISQASTVKPTTKIKKYSDYLVSFLFSGKHTKDRPLIAGYNSSTGDYLKAYQYTGSGSDYIYDSSTETFTKDSGQGTYSLVNLDPKIPDMRLSSSSGTGESDIIAEIESELVEPEALEENIAAMNIIIKTESTPMTLSSGSEAKACLNFSQYAETIPVNDDALVNFRTFESPDTVNLGSTTDSIVGGTKRYRTINEPLATQITSGFTYILNLYNEGAVIDARIIISPRKDPK